jgi:hypothetical protein
MEAYRVGIAPIWRSNLHIKWKQHHFGDPDSTMGTNILL